MTNCKFIPKIQKDYFKLLLSKKDIVFSENFSLDDMGKIIEDIDLFWREHLDIISLELSYFTEKETFFLAGTTYLDLENYNHYHFKTFGEEHIIPEPFLKFKNMICTDSKKRCFDLSLVFKKSYKNTVKLLSDFGEYFFYSSIE